jgi:hypothetical protein
MYALALGKNHRVITQVDFLGLIEGLILLEARQIIGVVMSGARIKNPTQNIFLRVLLVV